MNGAFRNLSAVTASALLGAGTATFVHDYFSVDLVAEVLKEIWPVQGILVGLVTTLFYRLHSDTPYVLGMTEKARRQLAIMVSKKSRRLGVLILLIAVPAVMCRLPSGWFIAGIYSYFIAVAMAIAVASAGLCLYLWPMWTELRAFVSDASALKEDDERRQKELEKLRESKEKA